MTTNIKDMKFAAAFSDGESHCVILAKDIPDLQKFFERMAHYRLTLDLSKSGMIKNCELEPIERP